jgi:hypothetical protein
VTFTVGKSITGARETDSNKEKKSGKMKLFAVLALIVLGLVANDAVADSMELGVDLAGIENCPNKVGFHLHEDNHLQ